ncbi:hypothetical protein HH682_12380 [Rosenbergiella sp. S61]|uniref:Protein FliT n=1 Tax=Rosenbergiella gaditana TaxID=2726987 RepID=A0ABS5SYM3_9GAMM|nr:hypothetical protein [Rosenbergiella gaditana]MBT0725199.1 hypothetical protein [Rosenbergiella gaditana]
MLDERRLKQLVSAMNDAIRQQDWDALSIANQRLTSSLHAEGVTDQQRQQLQRFYHAGLAECQRNADTLWHKIQKTLDDREAMAAYACFGDAESFSG